MNVLFDLDGTLTDPAPGILSSFRHALDALGLPMPDDAALRGCIGPPLRETFASLLATDDPDAIERAVDRYREYFGDRGLFENRVYDRIPEALDALHARGARLVVATSKPEVYAERILVHFGLDRHFEGVHGAELDGTRSAKADVIARALATHAFDPAATWMIGDRRHDVIGAIAVGVRPIGVTWGYGSRAELATAGAHRILERVTEIEALGT